MTAKYYTTKAGRLAAARQTLAAIKRGGYVKNREMIAFPADGYGRCEYIEDDRLAEAEPPEGGSRDGGGPEYFVAAGDSFETLALTDNPARTAVLNFACATTPGGGFLTGSKAQEECLCRMSTLYGSLTSPKARPYYRDNRADDGQIRAPRLLYSPEVYVFRNPDLSYLDEPVRTQVITAAAPNLHGRAKGAPGIFVWKSLVVTIAMMCEYLRGKADELILGAWGCGAFGNDPEMVARAFLSVLVSEGRDAGFSRVIFAIRDPESENYKTFANAIKRTRNVREELNKIWQ